MEKFWVYKQKNMKKYVNHIKNNSLLLKYYWDLFRKFAAIIHKILIIHL